MLQVGEDVKQLELSYTAAIGSIYLVDLIR